MLFIQSGTAFKGMNLLPVGGGFIPLREVAISKGTQLIKKNMLVSVAFFGYAFLFMLLARWRTYRTNMQVGT